MINSVVLCGRLTKDPELKYIPGSGTATCNFTIAIDRGFTKKYGTKETDFIPIQTWGKTAEACANNINKGKMVAIEGSIKVDSYKDNEGKNKTYTSVNASKVDFL